MALARLQVEAPASRSDEDPAAAGEVTPLFEFCSHKRTMEQLVSCLHGLEGLAWADQIERLRAGLGLTLGALGVRYFSYHLLRCRGIEAVPGGPAPVISTQPPCWTERYERRGGPATDPILSKAATTATPFAWWDALGVDADESFTSDVLRSGLVDALAFPIHLDGELAVLSVVPAAPHLVDSHVDLIYFIAHYFFSRTRRPLVEVALATSSRRRSVLSGRETQVLELTAAGNTTVQVSRALSISTKSVECHVESAKRKLQVANRTHAVAKAIVLGLISVP